MKCRFIYISGALAVGLFLISPMANAQNYGQMGNTSAGAVNWHMRQQLFWQENAPYMFRPTTPADSKGKGDSDEPVVLFSKPDVQGKVMPAKEIPKIPDPDQIQVK